MIRIGKWQATGKHRFRPATFRARITLVMTLLALTILALVDVAVYVGRRGMLQNNLDTLLLSVARTQAASSAAGSGHTPLTARHVLELPTGSDYETYVQIEDRQGHLLARTSNLEHLPPLNVDPAKKAQSQADKTTFDDVILGPMKMRCVCYPFLDARQLPLLAIIAISEGPITGSLQSLIALLCGSLVIGVSVFAVASSRLSLRLTRPLARIAAVAREVEETNLHARIPEVSPDAELRDVTDVLNAMLERLEAAFTQQQSLVAAQKALVASQQRFVADASHELRSPLSNLYGTVEVALRRPRTPEDYRETLSVSLSEIRRLSRLVEDLLTLSRADAGQFQLNRRVCDLGQIARDSAQVHAMRAEENGVMFQVSTPEPTPLYGDSDRLRQVVDNLLDNALKYAPPNTPIEITTGRQNKECVLEVRDHGQGISAAEMGRIFSRFYRTDLSRARASGGAGLGLAIVQAIVQAHGGTIGVESDSEIGTIFRVCLLAVDEEYTEQRNATNQNCL